MTDVALVVFGSCFAVITAFVLFVWFFVRKPNQENDRESTNHTNGPVRAAENDENVMRIGNRVIRNRHAQRANPIRRREVQHVEVAEPVRRADQSDDSDFNNDSDSDLDVNQDEHAPELPQETVMPEGKIGKMKRLKLEMKAEKRMARERELLEREERRKRQEKEDELRRQKEAEEEQKEREREEAERKAKEEKERREYEEYLKLKQSFQIEEDGYDANVDESEAQNKLIEFIETIRTKKIILLEELAAEFKMKTQEVIDRIQSLLESEQLTGVIDDRGKFIYITEEELKSVAKFIRQRGRVSIVDLVENSNQLIKL